MSGPVEMVRDEMVAVGAGPRPFRHGLSRVVLVPGVPALLPEYAGLVDPVAGLRAACRAAVGWLEGPVRVVADPRGRRLGHRVAEQLLGEAGLAVEAPDTADAAPGGTAAGALASYLVVGNGSAKRTEKAPGHLDPRAHDFDAALEAALRGPDPAALAALDEPLAADLWADVAALRELGGLLAGAAAPEVDYADDPFGVQYWVMRWTCAS